ncbi:hypothetical protein HMP06_2594 [Sphingomonas sp. HMP6]|nr:hypothetical protein HMP06_2594 [Sphingomonas sp. HMP6]
MQCVVRTVTYQKSADFRRFRNLARRVQFVWHGGRMVRIAAPKGIVIMFIRFESLQRVAVSVVASFVLSAALLSSVITLAPMV